MVPSSAWDGERYDRSAVGETANSCFSYAASLSADFHNPAALVTHRIAVSLPGLAGARWRHTEFATTGGHPVTPTRTSLDLHALRSASQGPVLGPGDDGWDAARQAWNLVADQHPAAVACVSSVGDVVAAVDFARTHGLRVAAQGTGHAATALASLEATVLLKTMRMGRVDVDPVARRARVEAGALWGELAVAAGEYGLAGLAGSSQWTRDGAAGI